MAVVVVLGQESDARLFAPGEALVALLGAGDFDGGRSERAPSQHDLVAGRNVHVPVAAIERFGPDQRCRIGGAPGEIARADGHAVDGNAIGQGKRRDGMRRNVRALRHVPDFDFLRKAIVGGDVRVGLVDGGDEDVLAVGRGIDRFVICRLSDGRDGPSGRVDQGELRGRVVVEEILVVLVAERVAIFVGAALSFFAVGLLDAWARWARSARAAARPCPWARA